MEFESRSVLRFPRYELSVAIEREFEHHMGASTVCMVPSVPVLGIDRFATTNGNALALPDGDGLLIYDATLLLYIDLRQQRGYHRKSERGWYFAHLRCEGPMLCMDYFSASGAGKSGPEFALAQLSQYFDPGLGSAAHGRFPSA